MFKFNLGDTLKDKITGFQGVATARTEWINGCVRYGIQPTKCGKDGKPIQSEYVNEQQLVLIKAAPKAQVKPSGGPQNDDRSPVRAPR